MIELANEKVNEAVNEKPVTQAEKIRQFVTEHPFTKATTIAKKMGVDRQYVYTVMWNMKNKTKLAKKGGGMQKKKAMTNKATLSLPKPNWKTIAFGSSDIPFYEDSVTDTTPKRMAQLAYEAGKSQVQVDKYWEAVGEVQKAALSPERIAELSAQAAKLRDRPTREPRPDAVNHPAHYKVGGIETIDFIEAKKLNYNIGNVIKYLTRADHKGNRKQDLEKAKWYLERELSTMS
jgi:hypothetical protein